MSNKGQEYLIALGGNLRSSAGVPLQTLKAALHSLGLLGPVILRTSRFYRTPCFPPGAGPDYVNAAAVVSTKLGASAFMEFLHGIERDFDRERKNRWANRTLDLDLIGFGQSVLPDLSEFRRWQTLQPARQSQIAPEKLIVPHPRMQDRGFVLVPLARVAPGWRHPVLDKTIEDMLADLPESALEGIAEIVEGQG